MQITRMWRKRVRSYGDKMINVAKDSELGYSMSCSVRMTWPEVFWRAGLVFFYVSILLPVVLLALHRGHVRDAWLFNVLIAAACWIVAVNLDILRQCHGDKLAILSLLTGAFGFILLAGGVLWRALS